MTHRYFIKSTALLILSALVLSGCSTGRNERVHKAERISKTVLIDKAQETTASSRPGVPEDVKYDYNEVTKAVRFYWKPAANAVSYQIKYQNQPIFTVYKTECYVTNVEEGDTVSIKICSVSSDNHFSDWLNCSCTARITVAAPESAIYQVDGDYVFFRWKEVENAAGYEVKYNIDGSTEEKTLTVNAPTNFINIKLIDGAKVICSIKAFKVVNGNTIYSETGSFTFEIPKLVSMSEYNYMTACTLGVNRMKEFVKAQGGSLQTSNQKDGRFLVTVRLKDAAQHTFKASAKRFLKDIGEAFVDSYTEGLKDNAIDTIPESESIKDYIHKLDEAATKTAKMGVIKRIFNRTKVDTDIHCVYQYRYTDLSPEVAKVLILKTNNKGFAKEFEDNFAKSKQANGYYKLMVKGSQQPFYMRIEENSNYWIMTLYPIHVMSLQEANATRK